MWLLAAARYLLSSARKGLFKVITNSSQLSTSLGIHVSIAHSIKHSNFHKDWLSFRWVVTLKSFKKSFFPKGAFSRTKKPAIFVTNSCFLWQDFFDKNQNKKKLQKGKWKVTNLPRKTYKYLTNLVFDGLITKPFSNNQTISSSNLGQIFIWDVFFVWRNAPIQFSRLWFQNDQFLDLHKNGGKSSFMMQKSSLSIFSNIEFHSKRTKK